MKISILTDLHFGEQSPVTSRRTEIADILLHRAVYRLNRIVKPDAVIVAGDLIDDAADPHCEEYYTRLASILAELESPYIAFPGNHDQTPKEFYEFFEDPGEYTDIAGIRFVLFSDKGEEHCNASRDKKNLDRIRCARHGYDGPLAALQHVNLFPPESGDAPYNYTNAGEIISAMKQEGVFLSISGHYHKGMEPIHQDGNTFINAPSLCETPFPFYTLVIEGEDVQIQMSQLKLEQEGLRDWHVHSQHAYCSKNMNIAESALLAEEFGLKSIGVAEHSGQLYYPVKEYWGGKCQEHGIVNLREEHIRAGEYFADLSAESELPIYRGLEVDCDYKGKAVVREEDRQRTDYVLGSVHKVPGMFKFDIPDDVVYNEFLNLNQKFLRNSNIDILAHPFRPYHHSHREVPESLFPKLVKLLKETDTAAEVNYHINEPDPGFFSLCLEQGVALSFGSDSHELCEVGEFAPHLAFLEKIGFNGDLEDILFSL